MSFPPPVTADHRWERRTNKPDGTGVFSAGLFYTHAGTSNTGFEWNLLAILDDESPAGEDCAFYSQANKYSTGSVWAACFETCDMSFGVKYGNQVAAEMDVWTNGPDPEDRRLGAHIVLGDARRIRTGIAKKEFAEASTGLLISNNGMDTNAYWRDAIRLQNFWRSGVRVMGGSKDNPAHRGFWFSDGYFVVGFDFSGGNFQTPIRLAAGQYISLEGTDSVKIGFENDFVTVKVDGQAIFKLNIRTGNLHLKGTIEKL